jgi:fructan beta-fructosidase
MKNTLYLLFALLGITSCKFSEKDNNFLTPSSFPKIHYSSQKHNVGAPSSFLFQNGIYSVFYQEFTSSKNTLSSIYKTNSTDLIHWQPAEKQVFGDPNQDILYANVVADSRNSTGFGSKIQSPIVALLLVNQAKNTDFKNLCFKVSYSTDQGKDWILDNSRVNFPDTLKNDFKPSLIWVEITQKWIMTIVDAQKIKFYSSKDLKTWKLENSIEKDSQYRDNIWLKATLFPINGLNWILLVDQEFPNPRDGSSVQYFIGSFDGHTFSTRITAKSQWLDYGKDNIFNVVCSGLATDLKPIVIGLKNNIDYPLIGSMKPFWGSFTFPRTLILDEYSGERILASEPIQNINKIQGKSLILKNLNVSESIDISSKITVRLTPSIITLKFETTEMTRMTFPSKFGIQLENDKGEKLIVGYDVLKQIYFVDRSNFLIVKDNSQFRGEDIISSYHSDSLMIMNIILDDSSIELFVENGKQALTENFFSERKLCKVKLFAENGIIEIKDLIISELNPIWARQ